MEESQRSYVEPKVLRNFRMAYVATVTLHDGQGEALHTIRYGRMPKGDVRGLCQALARDVGALRAQRPELKLVYLVDGAVELWNLFDGYLARPLGAGVTKLVDFWHTAEYLNAAAIVLETHGKAWPGQFRRWRAALKSEDGAAGRIADELEHSRLVDVVVDGQQPVRAALRYIRERLNRMNYAEARRQGLPIGSGNVEATCKSLVGLRMKRPGARWKHKTGEEVLQLRALVLSDRWAPAMRRALKPLAKPVRITGHLGYFAS